MNLNNSSASMLFAVWFHPGCGKKVRSLALPVLWHKGSDATRPETTLAKSKMSVTATITGATLQRIQEIYWLRLKLLHTYSSISIIPCSA